MPSSIRNAVAAVRAPASEIVRPAPAEPSARLRVVRGNGDAIDTEAPVQAASAAATAAPPASAPSLTPPQSAQPTPPPVVVTPAEAKLEPLDFAYAEPIRFTSQPLGNGKNLYTANVSTFVMQRALNRLALSIARERPELLEAYKDKLPAPFPYALVVDGQLGPNTNKAKMLLQEAVGGEADELMFTVADWQRVAERLAATPAERWVQIDFDPESFGDVEQRNAARVFDRLSYEDPVALMKLAVALGTPKETPYVGFAVSGAMVTALAAKMRSLGMPLTDERVAALYDLDRSGRGGVTFMRARAVADLLAELERFDVHEQDALIERAVAWVKSAEPTGFARFAEATGAADPERVLAALAKAVMAAESDFGRIADYDPTDVGLMQLTRMVVMDKERYFREDITPPGEAQTPAVAPASPTPGTAAAPAAQGAAVAPAEVPAGFPSTALDPLRNTAAGTSLVMDLFRRFAGQLTFTSAAYNVGPNKGELNLPGGEARLPNLYATLVHGMRIQRRFPLYLHQLRAAAERPAQEPPSAGSAAGAAPSTPPASPSP